MISEPAHIRVIDQVSAFLGDSGRQHAEQPAAQRPHQEADREDDAGAEQLRDGSP